ncbi:unnamed protein product [Sphagnum balticum]
MGSFIRLGIPLDLGRCFDIGGAYITRELPIRHCNDSPLAYAFMLVPHAYAQNIGRWPSPQKKWPSFFLPTLTDAQWSALSQWKRAGYDIVSMASVGFIRGMIAFAPGIVLYPVINALLAAVTIGVLQAASYFVGWYVPFTVTSSLKKHSTEWGELGTGFSWAIALSVLLS